MWTRKQDVDLSIRHGTEADIPACLAIDSSIDTDWVLHLERLGAQPELTFQLSWRRVADGRRRAVDVDDDFFRRWLGRGALLLVAELAGHRAGAYAGTGEVEPHVRSRRCGG